MQWDLGLEGLAVLGGMSLGVGAVAGLVVGKGAGYRLLATAVTTVACFGVGLFTSEVLFGWATEEELQPNIDGLSRDEVLLSSVLTAAVVVLLMRYLRRRAGDQERHGDAGRPSARQHGRHASTTR
ncbi:MAG TPA: hypothetical protein VFV76_12355 [Actinomycetes bacterium]|jgi:hypothetical protein|nr:hypothetical protein [Actinomycetes bacterium]